MAPCRSCLGRRVRRAGKRKQREAFKALAVPSSKFAPTDANEENWKHFLRLEVKSGAQVGPIATRYLLAETQSEAARPFGDYRPFAMVAMPKQWGTEGLVVMRLSDFRTLCDAVSASGESVPHKREHEEREGQRVEVRTLFHDPETG